MYGRYPERDSVSRYVVVSATSGFLVSEARARSVAMNDSDGRFTDDPCGFRIVTCRAAARVGCKGTRSKLASGFRTVGRHSGVPKAPRDRAP